MCYRWQSDSVVIQKSKSWLWLLPYKYRDCSGICDVIIHHFPSNSSYLTSSSTTDCCESEAGKVDHSDGDVGWCGFRSFCWFSELDWTHTEQPWSFLCFFFPLFTDWEFHECICGCFSSSFRESSGFTAVYLSLSQTDLSNPPRWCCPNRILALKHPQPQEPLLL